MPRPFTSGDTLPELAPPEIPILAVTIDDFEDTIEHFPIESTEVMPTAFGSDRQPASTEDVDTMLIDYLLDLDDPLRP
jgi:hypothetical protein